MKFNKNKKNDLPTKVNRLHKSTSSETKKDTYDINKLARKLKSRLSNAAKNLFRSNTDSDSNHNYSKEFVAMESSLSSPKASPKNALLSATSMDTHLLSPPTLSIDTQVVTMESPAPVSMDTFVLPTNEPLSPITPKLNTSCLPVSDMESSSIESNMSPTHTQPSTPLLANLNWSKEGKPILRNLDLLKHYLTFISQEIKQVDFEDEFIKLSFPEKTSLYEKNAMAELGASLLEQHILSSTDRSLLDYHEPSTNMNDSYNLKEPHPKKVSDTNRRRGRPSKSNNVIFNRDLTKPLQKKHKQKMIKKRNQEIIKKKQDMKQVYQRQDGISCICTSPFEEFGTMVQCDDCLNWLHLSCLDLDEKALEETFRCPSCFIKIDHANEDDTKLISGLTWRYAARHKSEEIACYKPLIEEEDDDEYEFENNIAIDPITSSLGIIMDYDLKYECHDEYSSISFPDDYPSLVSAGDTFSPSSPTMSFNDSWSYDLSSGASQYSQQEVGTPQEYFHPIDNWLAPPCAENVFLCENDKTHAAPLTLCSSPPPTPAEPSIVCAQELPEFNFWEINDGPSEVSRTVLISTSDGTNEIPDFNFWDNHL